jgi:hypothetical protein
MNDERIGSPSPCVRGLSSPNCQVLSCGCELPTFPTPTLKRLEFDKEFVPERRRFVVRSDRYLGGNAAPHDKPKALRLHGSRFFGRTVVTLQPRATDSVAVALRKTKKRTRSTLHRSPAGTQTPSC